jgi:hypothetical protein
MMGTAAAALFSTPSKSTWGRALGSQLSDLELDRADLVTVSPADAGRVTERQLRIQSSRPVETVRPHVRSPSRPAGRRIDPTDPCRRNRSRSHLPRPAPGTRAACRGIAAILAERVSTLCGDDARGNAVATSRGWIARRDTVDDPSR